MPEAIKNNEIYPAPGDIISERDAGTFELGRYIVVNRTVYEPNSNYYYIEYDICILYYEGVRFDSSMKPGVHCTISSSDFMDNAGKWEVVVESGLSWEDDEHNTK